MSCLSFVQVTGAKITENIPSISLFIIIVCLFQDILYDSESGVFENCWGGCGKV